MIDLDTTDFASVSEGAQAILLDDDVFTAILTGGLYNVDDPNLLTAGGPGAMQHPINPDPDTGTPDAYDVSDETCVPHLKPVGLLSAEQELSVKCNGCDMRDVVLRLYVYQALGYAMTRAARERARCLLNAPIEGTRRRGTRIFVQGVPYWITHDRDATNELEPALITGNSMRPASMEIATYMARGMWSCG